MTVHWIEKKTLERKDARLAQEKGNDYNETVRQGRIMDIQYVPTL